MGNAYKISFFLILAVAVSITSCSTTRKTASKSDITRAFSSEDRQFSYYFHEALRQRLAEKYDIALEMLLKCEQIDNTNATLMYEFANLYLQIGKVDYAIAYLMNAVRYDDSNIWYKINLASLYLAIGDMKSATEVYEAAAKKHPEQNELYENLYQLYLQQQRYPEAINALNSIEKTHGISEEVSFEKYRIYSNLGDNKKADKEIDALIKKFPNDMKYKILRGNIYEESGDTIKALELYSYVLEQEPDNGFARISLAEYYEKVGKQDKAIAEMNYALRSQNIDVETKIGILHRYIGLLENKEEWKQRLPALFETLLEMHPYVSEIHKLYAMYFVSVNELDEALKETETILDINPENEEAWEQMLQIKTLQKDWENMISIAQKAIEALPENPQWYSYLGMAYSQQKKDDEAIAAYEKGISLTSDYKKIKSGLYGSLADIYFSKNEKELAFESYEKALQYNPLNAHVLNNYAYHLSLEKKDLLRAETMAKKALELDPRSSTVLDTYAWVLFQQGYYNLAKRYLQEALKYIEEEDETLLEHYGDVLYKTDNKTEALKMWKKSQEKGNKSEKLLLKIEKQEYVE